MNDTKQAVLVVDDDGVAHVSAGRAVATGEGSIDLELPENAGVKARFDAWRQRRLALCQAAGEAGLTRLAAAWFSTDEATARNAVEMAKGRGWWRELAPLTKDERRLVQRQVALGWQRYVAEQGPPDAVAAADEAERVQALDAAGIKEPVA